MKEPRVISILILLILFFPYSFLSAQCSDAGICTIGENSPIENETYRFTIGAGYRYGASGKEEGVKFHTFGLYGQARIFLNTSLIAEFPVYNIRSGPLGEVSGIGDLMLLLRQSVYSESESSFALMLGVKLPSGDDNADGNLPQIYQSSLGTTDVLFGASYAEKTWGLSAGYQLAEKKHNGNAVTRLKRGDDIYGQVYYVYPINSWELKGDVIAIKRLQKSEIDAGGNITEVPDSDQIQINLGITAGYKLSAAQKIVLQGALPLLKREVNIDGLTRIYTLAIGVEHNF